MYNNNNIINSLTAVMVSSPNNIRVIDIKPNQLTFAWNDSVNLQHTYSFSNTDSIVYNIISSNCGTCPNSTTLLSATCVDFVADGSVCSFALQAVVCGNRFSPISDPVKIQIKGIKLTNLQVKYIIHNYAIQLYTKPNSYNHLPYYILHCRVLCRLLFIQFWMLLWLMPKLRLYPPHL